MDQERDIELVHITNMAENLNCNARYFGGSYVCIHGETEWPMDIVGDTSKCVGPIFDGGFINTSQTDPGKVLSITRNELTYGCSPDLSDSNLGKIPYALHQVRAWEYGILINDSTEIIAQYESESHPSSRLIE